MRSLDEFATAKLDELQRASLRRTLVDTTRVTGIWTLRNGRRLLSFCCNDYLNLTHHPAVKDAAIEALHTYGVGAGASRFVTGNHPLFAELETRLARWKDTEAACVFGSGYLANLGIIPPWSAKATSCWSTSSRMPACGAAPGCRGPRSSPFATTMSATSRSCLGRSGCAASTC